MRPVVLPLTCIVFLMPTEAACQEIVDSLRGGDLIQQKTAELLKRLLAKGWVISPEARREFSRPGFDLFAGPESDDRESEAIFLKRVLLPQYFVKASERLGAPLNEEEFGEVAKVVAQTLEGDFTPDEKERKQIEKEVERRAGLLRNRGHAQDPSVKADARKELDSLRSEVTATFHVERAICAARQCWLTTMGQRGLREDAAQKAFVEAVSATCQERIRTVHQVEVEAQQLVRWRAMILQGLETKGWRVDYNRCTGDVFPGDGRSFLTASRSTSIHLLQRAAATLKVSFEPEEEKAVSDLCADGVSFEDKAFVSSAPVQKWLALLREKGATEESAGKALRTAADELIRDFEQLCVKFRRPP